MTPAEELLALDVVEMSRALIGWSIVHEGCGGVIVETEAYHHSEPACHAFAGVTPRTRTLFGPAGSAYVYRSYGVHALLNVVSEREGVGAATLIRALEPRWGLERMRERRGVEQLESLCSGPGRLTQALGVEVSLNGTDLFGGPVALRPPAAGDRVSEVVEGTRIGITKATDLLWRFCAHGSRYVSKPWPPGLGAPSAIGARAAAAAR